MTRLNIENLGKSFRTYHSEWQRFANWFNIPVTPKEEHWILRHINFEIQQGESIGIIGKNGAGKSTLLKMITGTLLPTEGSVQVNGKIAAILELGMGFNPELTGRQNVIHAAGLMGYNTDDILARISEIQEFSEIGEYFDEPVRIYSSGMQVRVAFSIATAFRPDILIIDEALSVGDSYFQHKSFDRIREFLSLGTSLLIVSHDKNAISSLCTRALLLENGMIMKDGQPEDVFDYYNATYARPKDVDNKYQVYKNEETQTVSGSHEATFGSISLHDSNGNQVECVPVGEKIKLIITVDVHSDIEELVLGCGVKDRLGQVMFGTNTLHTDQIIYGAKPNNSYEFTIEFSVNLGPGSYSVFASVVSGKNINTRYQWVDRLFVFQMVNTNKPPFVGCLWNEMKFAIISKEQSQI